MTMKRTVAAAAIAVGMTVTATGSYASSSHEASTAGEAAVAKAERQLAAAQRALVKTETSGDQARSDSARKCKKKWASKKEARRVRMFMSPKKVSKIVGSKGKKDKSGELMYKTWRSCYTRYGFDVDFQKKGKKWVAYRIGNNLLYK